MTADDRDFRCDCQCHLPSGFYQPYLSPPPPVMRPCQLCIGGHERIAARWAMERPRPGPGLYIPHEFEPRTEAGRQVECAVCRNPEDHVVHLPPRAEDPRREGLTKALQYLILEYGYNGVLRALMDLREADRPSIAEAFKRGFKEGWNPDADPLNPPGPEGR